MDTKVAPMVYSRVLRALAAAGTNCAGAGQPVAEKNQNLLERLAKQLNEEFAMMGVRINSRDLAENHSALDIAQLITQKIA